MWGNNIEEALKWALVNNGISDAQKTIKNIKNGEQEQNPVVRAINPNNDPGTFQLLGLGTPLVANEIIDRTVPKDNKALALLLANLIEAAIASGTTKATTRVPFFSQRF